MITLDDVYSFVMNWQPIPYVLYCKTSSYLLVQNILLFGWSMELLPFVILSARVPRFCTVNYYTTLMYLKPMFSNY